MLSKAIVFCFCFLGVFALLFSAIPSQFMENQVSWSGSAFRTDQQVAHYFNMHNITLYDSQALGNLTFNDHVEFQAGLPSGWKLELWWDDQYKGIPTPWALGFGLLSQHWAGPFEYWTYEDLKYTSRKDGDTHEQLYKEALVDGYDSTMNGSLYDARCNSGIQTSILYTTNETSISAGWDAGHLSYMFSYGLNTTMSSVNMFTLLGKILTFQAPSLGISGWFGDLLNALIAIPIYAIAGFIIYKLITGIAPWLSGGSGD